VGNPPCGGIDVELHLGNDQHRHVPADPDIAAGHGGPAQEVTVTETRTRTTGAAG